MDCLFCKIANKEIKIEPLWENNRVMALLDIHPRAPGHTMVIPKMHANSILDLDSEYYEPVFEFLKKTMEAIKRALAPDGFTIGINQGEVAGQAIQHLHIHIIPRYKGDGGGSAHTIVNNPPKESLEIITNKIKAQIIK